MPPEHHLDQAHPEAVDWVLGTLSAAAATQFQQHLADCHPCQVAVAEFGQLGQMLQNLPPAVEPSPDLEARTIAGVLAAAASEAATTQVLRASPLATSAKAADEAATTRLRPIPKAPTPADGPRSIQPSGMPTVPPEISRPVSAAGQSAMGRPTWQGLSMAALTFAIEPDEYEGLSALIELDRAADGGDAHPDNGADVISKARTLMRTALAGKLEEADLPWAPSGEAVKERAAEATEPPSAAGRLMQDKKVRKYAAYVLGVGLVFVLWGGYVQGWHWTGFESNNQLWDWLKLLLVPVAVGTIPLWIQDRKYIGKGRSVTYAVVIVACGGVRARRLPDSAHMDRLPWPDAVGLVRTAPPADGPGGDDGADEHASPGVEGLAALLSEGAHRRPCRRVDRHRDRRLRAALEVDRVRRKHPVGLAHAAAPAPGVPDHPASGVAEMDHGQRGGTRRGGTRGHRGPNGRGGGPNLGVRTTAGGPPATTAVRSSAGDDCRGR